MTFPLINHVFDANAPKSHCSWTPVIQCIALYTRNLHLASDLPVFLGVFTPHYLILHYLLLSSMGKRPYCTDGSRKKSCGFDKLARLHENIANQMLQGGKSSLSIEDLDHSDHSEGGFSIKGDYDDFIVDPASDTGPLLLSQSDSTLFQQLLQMEEHEPDNQDDEWLERDSTSVDEATINAAANNNNDLPSIFSAHTDTFSVTDRAMVELIQCCNQARTSIKFLDVFLGILKRHIHNGFDINKAPKRSNFMAQLRQRIPCPKATPIVSPSGVLIPKFSLQQQLEDLLSSAYFQDIDCCAVNGDSSIRFQQYIPAEEEGIGEVLGADWYRRTYVAKVGDSPTYLDPISGMIYHNWLFPLCVYNDKTGVGAMEGKYTLEPLMISTVIIRRDCRQKEDAWRHLGFVPNYHHGSNDEEKENDAEKSLALFHEILALLLVDLVVLQQTPPLITVNLFGEEVNIRPIIVVAFVMGDQLSQDQHCGRKKSNSGGAGRVHRSCMTSFISACGGEEGNCYPLDKGTMDRLLCIIQQGEDATSRSTLSAAMFPFPEEGGIRDAARVAAKKDRVLFESWLKLRSSVGRQIHEKMYGMYPIRNAWANICFGSNVNGIYRATLDDPMHYSSSGMFMYLANVSFKGLLPSEAKKVEKYMREDFSNRCSIRYDFPRGKFSPGFTNCTLLTSNEKVGLIFALYLCLGTKRISDIFDQSIARQQGKYVDVECCFSHLGYSQSSLNRPIESKLPRIGDKYFYSDVKNKNVAERAGRTSDGYKLPRNLSGARRIVDHLDSFGLTFVLTGGSPLDDLQTEYLAQNLWFRSARKDVTLYPYDLASLPRELNPVPTKRTCEQEKLDLAKNLLLSLRKGPPPIVI